MRGRPAVRGDDSVEIEISRESYRGSLRSQETIREILSVFFGWSWTTGSAEEGSRFAVSAEVVVGARAKVGSWREIDQDGLGETKPRAGRRSRQRSWSNKREQERGGGGQRPAFRADGTSMSGGKGRKVEPNHEGPEKKSWLQKSSGNLQRRNRTLDWGLRTFGEGADTSQDMSTVLPSGWWIQSANQVP